MIIRVGNLDEVKANFPPKQKVMGHFLVRSEGFVSLKLLTLYRDNSDINCFWLCFVFFFCHILIILFTTAAPRWVSHAKKQCCVFQVENN